jgi:PAS domain S-box-containing protein
LTKTNSNMKSKQKKKAGSTIKAGHFQALIENAHDAIVVYDSAGRIKYASKSLKKILGFNVKEVVGKFGTAFLHPDDIERTTKSFYSLQKKPRKTITLFQRIRHKNGGYIWCEALLTNFNHIPEIRGIVSNFRDITEKKLAEARIKSKKQNNCWNRSLRIYPKEFSWGSWSPNFYTSTRLFWNCRDTSP